MTATVMLVAGSLTFGPSDELAPNDAKLTRAIKAILRIVIRPQYLIANYFSS